MSHGGVAAGFHTQRGLLLVLIPAKVEQLYDNACIAAGTLDDPRVLMSRLNKAAAETLKTLSCCGSVVPLSFPYGSLVVSLWLPCGSLWLAFLVHARP